MAMGDSITYGLGVHDWRETWPEVLATRLEREGQPHELAVFAEPGRDIKDHLQQLERWGSVVNPDVLIYQWYVNDIEVMSPFRPDRTRRWQQWAGHEWLRQTSYLYYFLDHRAGALLPSPGRSYVDYILQDLRPGTPEWAEFERYFHAFAVRVATIAKRRILLLYPQVPFKDRYPLQPLTDLMRTVAGPHTLAIPLAAWIRSGGVIENDTAAPFAVALRVPAGPPATAPRDAGVRACTGPGSRPRRGRRTGAREGASDDRHAAAHRPRERRDRVVGHHYPRGRRVRLPDRERAARRPGPGPPPAPLPSHHRGNRRDGVLPRWGLPSITASTCWISPSRSTDSTPTRACSTPTRTRQRTG